MQNKVFETSAHAKCILAGEHAVLRNCPAIVIPIHEKVITIHHEEFDQPISVICTSHYEEVFLLFFWKTVLSALEKLDKDLSDIRGELIISNNIPMGAGIGFSSALSVAISRWFAWKKWIGKDKVFEFARQLENLFHGTSSGVDIAGALTDKMIHFEMTGHITKKVAMHWQPLLYLSYSGNPKNTVEAVNQVKKIRQKQRQAAQAIDKKMRESVTLIEKGLKQSKKEGMELLVEGIENAHHCFDEWHLVTPKLQKHIDKLYKLGAVAVKPTGAGSGGYVLSLWSNPPPDDSKVKFIPLFA